MWLPSHVKVDVPTTIGRLGDRLHPLSTRFMTRATPATPRSLTHASARCGW